MLLLILLLSLLLLCFALLCYAFVLCCAVLRMCVLSFVVAVLRLLCALCLCVLLRGWTFGAHAHVSDARFKFDECSLACCMLYVARCMLQAPLLQ